MYNQAPDRKAEGEFATGYSRSSQPVRWWVAAAWIAIMLVLLYLVIFLLPVFLVQGMDLDPPQLASAQNQIRNSLLTALGGVGLLGSLFVGWGQLRLARSQLVHTLEATSRQASIEREGQVTERFTRAVGLLGDHALDVKVGAIYALERIARDSQSDHAPVMEILAAYYRDRWPNTLVNTQSGGPPTRQPNDPNSPDAQAILSVICRRRLEHEREGFRLDLSGTNLTGRSFRNGQMHSADLREVNLFDADLRGAHLEFAALAQSNLRGVDLRGAFLCYANLIGADLKKADLSGSFLYGADLSDAKGLTSSQLSSAHFNGATRHSLTDAPTVQHTSIPESTYVIVMSRASGKTLDVTGGNVENGTPVQQYRLRDDSSRMSHAQHWQIIDVQTKDGNGRVVRFRSRLGQVYLELQRDSNDDGVGIHVWERRRVRYDRQLWRIAESPSGGADSYSVFSLSSDKCLDVYFQSKADGQVVSQWAPNGTKAQEWAFLPVRQ